MSSGETMTPETWEKVKRIFNAALHKSPDVRGEFLRTACGDDETLFSHVKALVDSADADDDRLEAPALGSISKMVKDAVVPSRIGQMIGAYRIEHRIGAGGMGAVYLASRADSAFDKNVALKLIKRGFDTDEIIRRFQYERQILAGLEHANITRLLDGGSTEDGLPYLVMDYVNGEPLNKYSNERKLSIEKRLEIFLHICSAVSYAHRNLVVHRDLKPSNILVTADGIPKLLDFGIAKLVAVEGENTTVDTTFGTVLAMTPDYASPEQFGGGNVTTASDIYSLGVVLYELLTGHRPFHFKNHGAEEVSRFLEETSPTKPSSVCRSRGMKASLRSPQNAIRTLQGDLDNIVLMAIRREPERRYASVDQFAEDIRRYLAGLPVIAREEAVGYRVSKFVQRNKAGVAAGVGIAASLIGGLIAARRQARVASLQRDRARSESRKAEKVNRFLQKMLASADPRKAGKDLRVTQMLNIAAESVDNEFIRQPDIAADLNTTIGLTYLSLGQLEAAEARLRSALDTRRTHFPRRSVEVAMSLSNYGKLLQAKGDLHSAEPLYREALESLRTRNGGQDLDAAEVLDNLGYLLALKGDNLGAIELHKTELDIRTRVQGENHPDVARALGKLATVYSIVGEHELSERLHRKVWSIQRSVYGEEHPDIALTMINLVGPLLKTRPEEAEILSRKSLAMRRRLLGDDHSETAWSLYNLAYVLISRNCPEEAEAVARDAISKVSVNLPEAHPVVASSFLILGRSLMAKGSFGEAKQAFEKCLDLRLRSLPSDHWLLATTRSFLGECLFRLGHTRIGRQQMLESVEVLHKKLGLDHEQTIQASGRLRDLEII